MADHSVHYSAKSDAWATPPELFDKLNERFHFSLDVCASRDTAKLPRWYGEQCTSSCSAFIDGLKQSWAGEICFMNPPYSQLDKWLPKAAYESCVNGATVVALIPTRTDTIPFHAAAKCCSEMVFLKGRVNFVGGEHTAPFPSMLMIFTPHDRFDNVVTRAYLWDWRNQPATWG